MRMRTRAVGLFLLMALTASVLARAEVTPATLLAGWRSESAATSPFSATRGRQLFESKGREWSCSTCHTANPLSMGRHVVTGKPILPLAPGTNPQRFTDRAKVEKWFRRNCRDVLDRECTPLEKGDLLTWLVSLG